MKCFYHNDLDGRCAGSIVAQYTNNYNKEDYFEVDYIMNLPVDNIVDGEQIFFVDYSFKDNTKEILNTLMQKGCDVIWIDHHTSSINLVEMYPELNSIKGLRKDKISGAALTYMYFYNCEFDTIPYYIKLVSDYDCWIYKFDPDTTHFKLGIESENFDALDLIWKSLFDESDNIGYYKMVASAKERLIGTGKIIKGYIDQDNNYYREHFSYETEIEGYKCLVVNRKTNSWVFGEKYSDYPLVMVWVFNGTKYSYSIFSGDSTVDCSKIAEKFGGGGHRGAAGFSSDELLFKKI